MQIDFERRRQGTPIIIDRLDDLGEARALKRVTLASGTEGNLYDEGWVQKLIHLFPQALPITDIEPRFDNVVPVCLELPTNAGYVDNLFVTSDGDLVLAECKLWRNPQARREVVAQAIDYAHSISSWSYEHLEAAIAKAILPNGEHPRDSLFTIATGGQGGDEIGFIDAVSRNLRLGRMLLLIVGDGIREGVETLTDYLQDHAGSHFTLGLVEMAVHILPQPTDGYLVLPSVLSKTVLIERGIVRIAADGRIALDPPTVIGKPSADGSSRRTTISIEEFFETLGRLLPDLPGKLKHFLDQMVEISDARFDIVGATAMKLSVGTDHGMATLGHIFLNANGVDKAFFTNYASTKGRNAGLPDADMSYHRELAEAVGGSVIDTTITGKPRKEICVGEAGKTHIILNNVLEKEADVLGIFAKYKERLNAGAVSYTHLTLPTIYSV